MVNPSRALFEAEGYRCVSSFLHTNGGNVGSGIGEFDVAMQNATKLTPS